MIDFSLPYSKSKSDFISFLEGFLPEDYSKQEEKIDIPFQTKYFEKVTYLGETDNLNLAVYEVVHTSEHDARVGLTREMFRLMAHFGKRRSLVVLVPQSGNTYRFSLVTIDPKLDETGKITREYSNPKRYSFILGEGAKLHTPQKFLIKQGCVSGFDDLLQRFSVEVVNREFYRQLFDWFQWAIEEVKFPSGKHEEEIIRFISRMMFVWFLKQMKLIPEDIFDKNRIETLLNETENSSSSYYKAILQNLFFATLNTSMRKDLKSNEAQVREFLPYGKMTNKHGLQYYYRYKNMLTDPEEFQQFLDNVPFLNGGLFECLDERKNETGVEDVWVDVFTQNPKRQDLLIFPNKLFFEPEKGLLDLFHRYNFTVEESSPVDQNVGLDPEMLGSVFENLLASFNEETRENARNASGSFYTPKQVVDYMAAESIKQYLLNQVPEIQDEELHQLFDYAEEENPFNETVSQKVINALDNVKILDPACGSGAFPMGVLNLIVEALHKIDPDNELWKNRQIDNALKDQVDYKKRKEEIERIFNQTNNETNYARKLFIIENAINGVDIQPIAIQISKLRFFLSLIIEQEIIPESNNSGIIPLPNLETRFVCADSLIQLRTTKVVSKKAKYYRGTNKSVDIQQNLFKDDDTLPHVKTEKELKKIRHRYFEAKTIETKRKYREDDKQLRERLAKELTEIGYSEIESSKIASWNPYDKSKVADWFDPEFMLGVEDGFDIVIGNPPYIQLQENGGKLAERYKDLNYETFARTGDIYCLFYEKGNLLLTTGGNLCYITSNKWMRAAYGMKLRKYFAEQTNPLKLIDMGPGVFDAATVDTNILLFKNGGSSTYNLKGCNLPRKFKKLNIGIADYFENNFTTINTLSDEIWNVHSLEEINLEKKIREHGKQLKDWEITINRGVLTGYNPAFIIDGIKKQQLINADPKNAEIIKPLLRGRDTKRYLAEFNDNWLITTFPVLKIDINDYPTLKEYLASFGRKLEQTGETYVDKNGDKIKCRKKTNHKWFETQDNIAFHADFEKEKIVWKRIGSVMRFSYDTEKMYCLDSTCIATGEKIKYLLGLLNSKLCLYELFQIAPKTGTGDMIISVQALSPLYVHYPDSQTEKLIVEKVEQILTDKKAGNDTQFFETQIDLMVYKLYELTYDEALLVDPELPGIISREDYEKAGVEELAEWEI